MGNASRVAATVVGALMLGARFTIAEDTAKPATTSSVPSTASPSSGPETTTASSASVAPTSASTTASTQPASPPTETTAAPAASTPPAAGSTPVATQPAAPAAAATAQPAATTAAEAGGVSPEASARARLNGTRWQLQLSPMYGSLKPGADTVIFDNGRVSSTGLNGYAPSSFTVKADKAGATTWEAMQTNPQEGVVFWRGELKGDEMRGSLSKQPIEGSAEDYSFIGRETRENPPAAAAPASTDGSPAVPAPAAQLQKSSRQPTHRSWLQRLVHHADDE